MHALTYFKGVAIEGHVHEIASLEEAHNELLLVRRKISLYGRIAWSRQYNTTSLLQFFAPLLSNF